MLPLRALRLAPARLLPATQRAYSTQLKEVTASDPSPAAPAPNVSNTNQTATSSTGSHDSALVEAADAAAEMRAMQAPNRRDTWTRSQQAREKAMVGPRFEQMVMEDQVWPPGAAVEYGRD
jgi:NADH dehydrogenase (ubiquinone) Fe-S protein 6